MRPKAFINIHNPPQNPSRKRVLQLVVRLNAIRPLTVGIAGLFRHTYCRCGQCPTHNMCLNARRSIEGFERMRVEKTDIAGVLILIPQRYGDERGFFCETYAKGRFKECGISDDFVQDNYSLSYQRGVVRGLHFQTHPFAQAKLVRAGRGRLLDVVVDIRHGSPTFGRHIAVEMDADTGNQLYIPVGLAHGFCTLEPNTELVYKVSAPYAPECDRGLAWDDPELAIGWPVVRDDAILSAKDRSHPRLRDLPAHFNYAGPEF
jgi:dTDP-4-dehydrorhamnose 3,5-epimerase